MYYCTLYLPVKYVKDLGPFPRHSADRFLSLFLIIYTFLQSVMAKERKGTFISVSAVRLSRCKTSSNSVSHQNHSRRPKMRLEGIEQFTSLPLAENTLQLHVHLCWENIRNNLWQILATTSIYQLIFTVVSPAVSANLLPRQYASFTARLKLKWNDAAVSLFQSTVITITCAMDLFGPSRSHARAGRSLVERLLTEEWMETSILNFALGYFIWHFYTMVWYVGVFGPPMAFHSVVTLVLAACGYVSSARSSILPRHRGLIRYSSDPFSNIGIQHFCWKKQVMSSEISTFSFKTSRREVACLPF